MTSRKPLITVSDVKKEFSSAAGKTTILKEANFVIEEGSFTVIYGRSGSGKSTLLNSLVGLEPPTSGLITYEGSDIYSMSQNERAYFRAHTLGMVHQQNHWVHSLTILENVALPLNFIGYSKQDAEYQAYESLKRLNMEKHASKYPKVLSGGEQQRVAMARATVNNPSCIVADEPTGNLDSFNGDAMIDLLRYFNKELDRTIILVTHNLEYLSVGDKLLLIDDGEIVETQGAGLRSVVSVLLGDMQKRITKWGDK